MAVDPAVRRVILNHQAQTEALRARIVRFIEATWGSLRSWRDADIDRFVAAVAPVVEGGQRLTANLTDAYLAAVAAATLDTPIRPRGIDPRSVTTEALRGIGTAEMWQRVGVTVWTALSRGASLPDAVDQGLTRAISLATTNLQLAKTHTSRSILSADPGVVGYRRVLEGVGSCGLCAVASTQRYHDGDLMPIHPGCDCSVAPIYGTADPGRVIDPDALSDIRETLEVRFGVETNRAEDLRDQLVVHEHGEIGPVLAVRGQTFTGPSDI